MRRGQLAGLTFLLGATTGFGCQAIIGDPPNPGAVPGGGAGPGTGAPLACNLGVAQVAVTPLRRLTPIQYRNTVRDLLGDQDFTGPVDDDELIVTERGVRQFRDAAELAVSRRASWTRPVFPCETSGAADDACVASFIDAFGPRAFRRPITDEDRERLTTAYRNAIGVGLSFDESMEVLVEIMLQSPEFIYIDERGAPGTTQEVRQLSQYEIASRLSYFIWNTMPDDELFEAAQTGVLEGEGLRAQAERLIDDPRAESTRQQFFWHWLQLDGGRLHNALEETSKDPTLYPEYDPGLRAAMRTETEELVRDTFVRGGSFADLFTTTRAYVNGPLAEVYGVSGPTTADDWQWVDLNAAERAGILTRAAFETVFSSATVQSPIRRGVYVIEELFCNELGTPPPNASDTSVVGGEVTTDTGETVVRSVREDVTVRTSEGVCVSCHSVINPVGFAFEHYDGIGRYRTEELTSGRPLDSSGVLSGTDVDGDIANATELSARIASSARARECFAKRWFTSAMGRAPQALDTCSVQEIAERFSGSGSMRDLMIAIVESDAFRYVNLAEGTAP